MFFTTCLFVTRKRPPPPKALNSAINPVATQVLHWEDVSMRVVVKNKLISEEKAMVGYIFDISSI